MFVNMQCPISPQEAAKGLEELGINRNAWQLRYTRHTFNRVMEILKRLGHVETVRHRLTLTRPVSDVAEKLRDVTWRATRVIAPASKNHIEQKRVVILDSPKLNTGLRLYPRGSRWSVDMLTADWVPYVDGLRMLYEQQKGKPPIELLCYQGRIWNVTDPDNPVVWGK